MPSARKRQRDEAPVDDYAAEHEDDRPRRAPRVVDARGLSSSTARAVPSRSRRQVDLEEDVARDAGMRGAVAASRRRGAGSDPVLWVKRIDVAGASYDKVRSEYEDVADVKAAVVAEQRMNAAPALVTLLHVAAAGVEPTAGEEAAAIPLTATLPLAEAISQARPGARVGDRVWLLASAPVVAVGSVPAAVLSLDSDPSAGAQYDGLIRDTSLTRFYAAVMTATCDASSDSGVKLWRLNDPSGASKYMQWPLLEQRVLLERHFYAAALSDASMLASLPEAGPQVKVAVLGQPGIGKSAFGLWLLAQLLRNHRSVVYSRDSTKTGSAPQMEHFVFHHGVAFQVSTTLAAARKLLASLSVVHICDSCAPPLSAGCHKVMITSPDPTVWRWFVRKQGATRVFFPCYSDAELEVLRASEFGKRLSRAVLRLRVRAWGPIPRQVFALNQQEVYADVQEALQGQDLESLRRAMDTVEQSQTHANDTPHSLFLLTPAANMLEPGVVSFRSPAIATRVMRALATHSYVAVVDAMQQLMRAGPTRGVAGTLFEAVVLERFRKGGNFLVRPLIFVNDGAEEATDTIDVSFPRAEQTWPFNSVEDITYGCECGSWTLETGRFVPTKRNYTAIDSIEVGARLMQMTATRGTHSLKVTSGSSAAEGLAALARTLLPHLPGRWVGTTAYLEVFFVVPQGLGDSFKPQTLEHATQQRVRAGPRGQYNLGFRLADKVVEVRQFVMELPVDEFRELEGGDTDEIDAAAKT